MPLTQQSSKSTLVLFSKTMGNSLQHQLEYSRAATAKNIREIPDGISRNDLGSL